ncbi:MAG: hypothetical protein LC732_09235 [Acidobacteria bacterium]|nr:hypothetical protein [Acidobacteriota bacterium]
MISIGTSPEGRQIWMVIASKEGSSTPEGLRRNGRPTILAHSGIHSGEIDGKDAGMMLLRDMTVRGLEKDGKLGSGPENQLCLPTKVDNPDLIRIWASSAESVTLSRERRRSCARKTCSAVSISTPTTATSPSVMPTIDGSSTGDSGTISS